LILLQLKSTLHQLIAEHRIASSIVRGNTIHDVSLTGQRCNHSWRWCDHERDSIISI
jgi:hypothetical protein